MIAVVSDAAGEVRIVQVPMVPVMEEIATQDQTVETLGLIKVRHLETELLGPKVPVLGIRKEKTISIQASMIPAHMLEGFVILALEILGIQISRAVKEDGKEGN